MAFLPGLFGKKGIIRKGLRELDPTSSKAALGGVVRAGVGLIPGGSAIMGGVDSAKKVLGNSRSTPKPAPAKPPATVQQALAPAPMMPAPKVGGMPKGMLLAGGAAAVALVLVLALKK